MDQEVLDSIEDYMSKIAAKKDALHSEAVALKKQKADAREATRRFFDLLPTALQGLADRLPGWSIISHNPMGHGLQKDKIRFWFYTNDAKIVYGAEGVPRPFALRQLHGSFTDIRSIQLFVLEQLKSMI